MIEISPGFQAWVNDEYEKWRARFSGRQIWSAGTRHRFGFGWEFRRKTASRESQNRRPGPDSFASLQMRREGVLALSQSESFRPTLHRLSGGDRVASRVGYLKGFYLGRSLDYCRQGLQQLRISGGVV